MKAVWNGVVIAQSAETINIGGATFFPEATVKSKYLKSSDMQSHPTDLGRINYRNVEVDGSLAEGAAIQYSEINDQMAEKVAMLNIKEGKLYYSSYIGFTNGVQVVKE